MKTVRKKKTKHILFEQLEMSNYLQENKRTSLSKVIFGVRSKTLDLKDWCPWKYDTVNCVACGNYPETIDHFSTCKSYRNKPLEQWEIINGNETDKITAAGVLIEKRIVERENIIKKQEAGRTSLSNSTAPGNC